MIYYISGFTVKKFNLSKKNCIIKIHIGTEIIYIFIHNRNFSNICSENCSKDIHTST